MPRRYPCASGLCRLLSAPAAFRTFPTLSLRIFLHVSGPIPRLLLRCTYPFLPAKLRPSRRCESVGAWQLPIRWQLLYGILFRGCNHSLMFKPADLLATQVAPTAVHSALGSHGFYIRASHSSLPLCAPDMLTVRFGQLTVRGLAPL
jgi:hypothetical protein